MLLLKPPLHSQAEADAADAAEGGYDADVATWIRSHGTNDQLQSFFISKLKLVSPCEDGFRQLSQVGGEVRKCGGSRHTVVISSWCRPTRTASGSCRRCGGRCASALVCQGNHSTTMRIAT